MKKKKNLEIDNLKISEKDVGSSPVQIGSSTGWSTTVGDQKISGGKFGGFATAAILYD